jgi:DNA transposition AAA+ family ATPase
MPKYPTDPEVRTEILKLRQELKLTNKGLAQTLGLAGVNETFLSKYAHDKLDRLVENFEPRFRDTVKGLRERIAFGSEIFETSLTRKIRNACDLVRRTGDLGLITSKAGHGKSSGGLSYFQDNPSTVFLSLNATTRSANKVESLIFARVDTQSWKSNSPRFDFLAHRFHDASRLIIIDNAQRLDSSGRQWVCDFQDVAKSPVLLLGNPEAVEAWQLIDQQRSRIGLCNEYELDSDELPACARRVATQVSDPATADAVEDLVAVIAAHEGCLRAVKKTVILAQELRTASAKLKDDPRAAIRAAHTRLLRDYELPVG